jgi:spermidine/putrescine transport system ATP-binding protein
MADRLFVENVSKRFSSAAGVSRLNFELHPGEGFSLLGPSGCGKSTTLRLLGGFEAPDQGRILHGNRDITSLPPQDRDIRTVFQRYALFPHLSVKDNIAFGLKTQGLPTREIKSKVDSAIELLDIPHLLERSVQKLSGGEQQRVALARALVTEPDILLLDEPLSAMDQKLRERMHMELNQLRRKLGSTFLFVTHDQAEAMAISDRLGVMREGELIQVGSAEEIYLRPKNRFVAQFIGQANFLGFSFLESILGEKSLLPNMSKDQEWMIRPEHFSPRLKDWTPPKGHLALPAHIVSSSFLGSDRLTHAITKSGQELTIRSPGFEPCIGNPGDSILASWESEDTWIVGAS